LGWIGLNGAAELSIVIRTIVAQAGQLRFGVGGGVVADSTPQGEYDEMRLKAKASIVAIRAAHGLHVEKPALQSPLGERLWLNGCVQVAAQAAVSVSDRGLTLADGVFETILIESGQPVWWDAHWQRLCAGAQVLHISLPFTQQQVQAGLAQLPAQTDLTTTHVGHQALAPNQQGREAQRFERCVLRVTLTRGAATYRGLWNAQAAQKPTLLMTLSPWAAMPAQHLVIARQTCRNDRSPLSRIKSLAYGDNLLARQEALAQGASDAILLDTQSRIACTTVGNLFVEIDGRWFTPALHGGVLPGVARASILGCLQVVETELSEPDLAQVSRAFISNSLGLSVVASLQGRALLASLPHQLADQFSFLLK
jgi:branched-chain amino acid aminotransferase